MLTSAHVHSHIFPVTLSEFAEFSKLRDCSFSGGADTLLHETMPFCVLSTTGTGSSICVLEHCFHFLDVSMNRS